MLKKLKKNNIYGVIKLKAIFYKTKKQTKKNLILPTPDVKITPPN